MPNDTSNSAQATPTALDLLTKFLDENNIELRLTPLAQIIDGGAVMIQPPQIVAQFKKVAGSAPVVTSN